MPRQNRIHHLGWCRSRWYRGSSGLPLRSEMRDVRRIGKLCRNAKRLLKAAITEPPATLKGSKRLSLNFIAGSVWFGVTNRGVVRVMLNMVSSVSRLVAAREKSNARLR